ncbi:spatacsin [Anaeramoeba ignava]|uniref:Spatacsin n=1 Tax=Anaeramoeba ignava TaxID=1746090 RepID=A0A9Q0LC31_ANAIG|nr:spatacsin [Anaeramoeba ignava]
MHLNSQFNSKKNIQFNSKQENINLSKKEYKRTEDLKPIHFIDLKLLFQNEIDNTNPSQNFQFFISKSTFSFDYFSTLFSPLIQQENLQISSLDFVFSSQKNWKRKRIAFIVNNQYIFVCSFNKNYIIQCDSILKFQESITQDPPKFSISNNFLYCLFNNHISIWKLKNGKIFGIVENPLNLKNEKIKKDFIITPDERKIIITYSKALIQIIQLDEYFFYNKLLKPKHKNTEIILIPEEKKEKKKEKTNSKTRRREHHKKHEPKREFMNRKWNMSYLIYSNRFIDLPHQVQKINSEFYVHWYQANQKRRRAPNIHPSSHGWFPHSSHYTGSRMTGFVLPKIQKKNHLQKYMSQSDPSILISQNQNKSFRSQYIFYYHLDQEQNKWKKYNQNQITMENIQKIKDIQIYSLLATNDNICFSYEDQDSQNQNSLQKNILFLEIFDDRRIKYQEHHKEMEPLLLQFNENNQVVLTISYKSIFVLTSNSISSKIIHFSKAELFQKLAFFHNIALAENLVELNDHNVLHFRENIIEHSLNYQQIEVVNDILNKITSLNSISNLEKIISILKIKLTKYRPNFSKPLILICLNLTLDLISQISTKLLNSATNSQQDSHEIQLYSSIQNQLSFKFCTQQPQQHLLKDIKLMNSILGFLIQIRILTEKLYSTLAQSSSRYFGSKKYSSQILNLEKELPNYSHSVVQDPSLQLLHLSQLVYKSLISGKISLALSQIKDPIFINKQENSLTMNQQINLDLNLFWNNFYMKTVYLLIENSQFDQASLIIENMGGNPFKIMKNLSFLTLKKEIREKLYQFLKQNNQINQSEKRRYLVLLILHKLYPSSSYNQTHKILEDNFISKNQSRKEMIKVIEQRQFLWLEAQDFQEEWKFNQENKDQFNIISKEVEEIVTFQGIELIQSYFKDVSEKKSDPKTSDNNPSLNRYLLTKFKWFLSWDKFTKQRIMFEFLQKDDPLLNKYFNFIGSLNKPPALKYLFTEFIHLISSFNYNRIQYWISNLALENINTESLKNIFESMIIYVLRGSTLKLKNLVLNLFSLKRGIYFSFDNSNETNLFRKICFNFHLLFNDEIRGYSLDKLLPKQQTNNFHQNMINLFIQNELFNIFEFYLVHFQLTLQDKMEISNPLFSIIEFCVNTNPTQKMEKYIKHLLLLNTSILLNTQISNITNQLLINQNKFLIVLGMFMFNQKGFLSNFILQENEQEYVPLETISKCILDQFPKLYSFINSVKFLSNLVTEEYKINDNKPKEMDLVSLRKDTSLLNLINKTTSIHLSKSIQDYFFSKFLDHNSNFQNNFKEILDILFYLSYGQSVSYFFQLIKQQANDSFYNSQNIEQICFLITSWSIQNFMNNLFVTSSEKIIYNYYTQKVRNDKLDGKINNLKNIFKTSIYSKKYETIFYKEFILLNNINESQISRFKYLLIMVFQSILFYKDISMIEFVCNELSIICQSQQKNQKQNYIHLSKQEKAIKTLREFIQIHSSDINFVIRDCLTWNNNNWISYLILSKFTCDSLDEFEKHTNENVTNEYLKQHLLRTSQFIKKEKSKTENIHIISDSNEIEQNLNNDNSLTKGNLFDIILNIQKNNVNPSEHLLSEAISRKEPIFALISLSFGKKEDLLDCLISFLISSNQKNINFQEKLKKTKHWEIENLNEIIIWITVEIKQILILIQAFELFDSQNLIIHFFRFLRALNMKQVRKSKDHLLMFMNSKKQKYLGKIEDIKWVEDITKTIIKNYLEKVDQYTLKCLVNILNDVEFSQEYHIYWQVMKVFENIDITELSIIKEPIENIDILTNHKKFKESVKYSEIVGVSLFYTIIPNSISLIHEYQKSGIWKIESKREILWNQLAKIVYKNTKTQKSELNVDFFLSLIKMVFVELTYNDFVVLFTFAKEWISKYKFNDETIYTQIENQIWLFSLLKEIEYKEFPSFLLKMNPEPSKEFQEIFDNVLSKNNWKEKIKLQTLNFGKNQKIQEAGKLCEMTQFKSKELAIIHACEIIQKRNEEKTNFLEMIYSQEFNKDFNIAKIIQTRYPRINFNLISKERLLNKLVNLLVFGRKYCQRLITNYQISQILKQSYEQLEKEPYQVILKLLIEKYFQSILWKFENEENLLFSSIISFTQKSDNFQKFVSLSQDSVMFGNELLEKIKEIPEENPHKEDIEVDIIIRSRQAFDIKQDSLGSRKILEIIKEKSLIYTEKTRFDLLAQLLTGMTEYQEIQLLLSILVEHNQFKLISNQIQEKLTISILKISLIEFMKTYTDDDEKLLLFYCTFRLWTELGNHFFSKAFRMISKFDPNGSFEETEMRKLIEIGDLFFNAADSFAKSDCPQKILDCISYASLIGAQIRNPDLFLLNQEKSRIKIRKLIGNETINFFDALIISEVYHFSLIEDWCEIVFKQFIEQKNINFLDMFFFYFDPQPKFFSNFMNIYIGSQKNNSIENQMKSFILMIPDKILQFEIGSQLKFDKVVYQLKLIIPDIFNIKKF